MRPTGDLWSHRSLWSVGSPYEITIVTCVLPVLCAFRLSFAQYSMNPYVYPSGFEGAPVNAVRARADAVRALDEPTTSLADQYGANTGPLEPTSMCVIWTTHDSLRAEKSTEAHL